MDTTTDDRASGMYGRCSRPECGAELTWRQRKHQYCSMSCRASHVNTLRPRRAKPGGHHCELCGVTTGNPRFCSRACAQAATRRRETARIIEADGVGIGVGALRRFLIRERGLACEICMASEWRGAPIPVVMDHIDGHAENNRLSNLRLVCPNCDAQLPTFKARNRGNGRAWRRRRYADGKSY